MEWRGVLTRLSRDLPVAVGDDERPDLGVSGGSKQCTLEPLESTLWLRFLLWPSSLEEVSIDSWGGLRLRCEDWLDDSSVRVEVRPLGEAATSAAAMSRAAAISAARALGSRTGAGGPVDAGG